MLMEGSSSAGPPAPLTRSPLQPCQAGPESGRRLAAVCPAGVCTGGCSTHPLNDWGKSQEGSWVTSAVLKV